MVDAAWAAPELLVDARVTKLDSDDPTYPDFLTVSAGVVPYRLLQYDPTNMLREAGAGDFKGKHIFMTWWAVSRHESMKDAWSLLDCAKGMGVYSGQLCPGELLTECEQRN